MTKIKTTLFDAAKYLDTPEAISAYMDEALATHDMAFITKAIGTVARARGMTDIAKKTKLTRASLYKAFGDNGNPGLDTVLRVMKALGIKLSASPA